VRVAVYIDETNQLISKPGLVIAPESAVASTDPGALSEETDATPATSTRAPNSTAEFDVLAAKIRAAIWDEALEEIRSLRNELEVVAIARRGIAAPVRR